jgi:hypothetical protein
MAAMVHAAALNRDVSGNSKAAAISTDTLSKPESVDR